MDLPDSFPWPERTREWWKSWQAHPAVDSFLISDWEFLFDTALVHADVWGNWNLDRLSELRQRQSKFGVTPEDRKRLGVTSPTGDVIDPLDEIAARRTARGGSTARSGGTERRSS